MGDAWATGDEWDGLEYGDAVGERLRQARRNGLVWNRAAPDEILVRLLDTTPSQLWRRDLPSAVLDAAVEHPDRAVRGRLAEARMHAGMSAEQWSGLLLGESDQRTRHLWLWAAADARAELTGRAYEVLAADPSARIRQEVARFSGLPPRLRTALAADPEPQVRAAACAGSWQELGDAVRARLAADPAPAVRTAVTSARHEEVPLTVAFFEAAQSDRHLVGDHRLERRLAARLAADEDPRTRRALAGKPVPGPGPPRTAGRRPG